MYAEQMQRKLSKDCETQTALPRINLKYNSIQSNVCNHVPCDAAMVVNLALGALEIDCSGSRRVCRSMQTSGILL